MKKLYAFTYISILFLRIIVAFTVYINPWFGITLSTFFDAIDGFFASRDLLTREQYQLLDKFFDFFWYTIALMYSYNALAEYFALLFLLYLYRAVGMILFYLFKQGSAFFIFANFFENVFILIVLGKTIPFLNFILEKPYFYLFIIIAIILKLIQEWIVHISKGSFTEKFLGIKMNWKTEQRRKSV